MYRIKLYNTATGESRLMHEVFSNKKKLEDFTMKWEKAVPNSKAEVIKSK